MVVTDNFADRRNNFVQEKLVNSFQDQCHKIKLNSRSVTARCKRFQEQSFEITWIFLSLISSLFHTCTRILHSIVDRICSLKPKFLNLIKTVQFVFKYIWRIIIVNAEKLKINHQKQRAIPGLCGLINIGNTCYMNSAIQCLSNIPYLTKWAMQQFPIRSTCVTEAYTSLIKLMWSGKKSYVNPETLKQYMSKYASIFGGYGQNDAHEFMNSLINALLQDNSSNDEQQSIITDLFRLQIESRVTCTECNTCDYSKETTYCLSLPLADEPTDTLDNLIADFLKEDILCGEYHCSTCQTLRTAKQKTSICFPLPPVVIIQLKRFTFNDSDDKLKTFVDYPVTDWNLMGSSDGERYDLTSVVIHTGNLKNGHYTTFARHNGDGLWYHFNDERVEPVCDTKEIIDQNAYILIYLKK